MTKKQKTLVIMDTAKILRAKLQERRRLNREKDEKEKKNSNTDVQREDKPNK